MFHLTTKTLQHIGIVLNQEILIARQNKLQAHTMLYMPTKCYAKNNELCTRATSKPNNNRCRSKRTNSTMIHSGKFQPTLVYLLLITPEDIDPKNMFE